MAAYVFVRSESARDGLQPFDPGRHMTQVADLVGQVFAAELDDRGRNALREMHWVGRLSPFLGGAFSMALVNEDFSGLVWVEDGRVVGNVTLQSVDRSGSRWRISNVAVAPVCRGRGIGRALMQAALREIAQRGGNWALLQVVAQNHVAHQLYLDLRFEDIARSGAWRLSTPAPELRDRPVPRDLRLQPELRPLGSRHRQAWLALARAARSQLAQWAEPIRTADYQLSLDQLLGEALGRATGLYRVVRWGAWRAERLIGAVEARADSFSGINTLRLLVHPEARGVLEAVLLAQGLASVARCNALPVVMEHDGEHQEATIALQVAGFHIQRDLITMRRAITPADAG